MMPLFLLLKQAFLPFWEGLKLQNAVAFVPFYTPWIFLGCAYDKNKQFGSVFMLHTFQVLIYENI